MNTALPCRKGVDDAKRSFFFFCFTNHDSSTKGAVFLFSLVMAFAIFVLSFYQKTAI